MISARLRRPTALILGLAFIVCIGQLALRAQSSRAQDGSTAAPRLLPTNHPPVPSTPAEFLFVPVAGGVSSTAALETPADKLARGVRLIAQEKYAEALPLVSDRSLNSTLLAGWARYYSAVALRNLDRLEEANASLIAASAGTPVGSLEQAIPSLRAEIAMAKGDAVTALAVLESISPGRSADPEAILSRLAAAAERAGEPEKAIRAYRRIYYEFPLSSEAETAASALTRLSTGRPPAEDVLPLQIDRAEALFAARRWSDARDAFQDVGRMVSRVEDRELAALRVAQCDFHLGRLRPAREALMPFVVSGTRQAEARYYALQVTKGLGDDAAYELQARRYVQDFPSSAWTEEVLNALASYFIVNSDDERADNVFREMLVRFPNGRFADRAAWKVGWTSYRKGKFAETADIFDRAAALAPRADYRPAWLYWSARAYDQIDRREVATARYELTATDYLNSYYGRLASRRLAERGAPAVDESVTFTSEVMPSPLIPTSALVRELVRLGLYETAFNELEYAERVWGTSPAVQATTAWIRHHRAAQLESMERFQNLRGAINQMKRAYPQYLAAGGESLPPDVLKIIFPLDYWPLIKAQSEARGLDPYLMAALVAQESTFTVDVRSSANAYGLMQLVPATGRRYAPKAGLRFSASLLTQAEPNVRMGTIYFKELVDQFNGGAYLALASYNAGESRVGRWVKERPGLPQDEFIDDIPFPETQNYVKRILGTAEDYRRLYGSGLLMPGLGTAPVKAAAVVSRPVVPKAEIKRTAQRPRPSAGTSRTTRTTRAR